MADELAGLGWYNFVKQHQHPSSINPRLANMLHPAAPYLQRLARRGVPAPSSSRPWPLQQCHNAFTRGPHPSTAHQ
jgi:hypothetical protein